MTNWLPLLIIPMIVITIMLIAVLIGDLIRRVSKKKVAHKNDITTDL